MARKTMEERVAERAAAETTRAMQELKATRTMQEQEQRIRTMTLFNDLLVVSIKNAIPSDGRCYNADALQSLAKLAHATRCVILKEKHF